MRLPSHLFEDVTHDGSVDGGPDHSPRTQFASRRLYLSLFPYFQLISARNLQIMARGRAGRQIGGLDRGRALFPLSQTHTHFPSPHSLDNAVVAKVLRIGGSGRRRALCSPNGRSPRGSPFARSRSSSSGGRGRRGSHSPAFLSPCLSPWHGLPSPSPSLSRPPGASPPSLFCGGGCRQVTDRSGPARPGSSPMR